MGTISLLGWVMAEQSYQQFFPFDQQQEHVAELQELCGGSVSLAPWRAIEANRIPLHREEDRGDPDQSQSAETHPLMNSADRGASALQDQHGSAKSGKQAQPARDGSRASPPVGWKCTDGESHASQNNCEKSWPPGSGRQASAELEGLSRSCAYFLGFFSNHRLRQYQEP
jgi:hypothetical protein